MTKKYDETILYDIFRRMGGKLRSTAQRVRIKVCDGGEIKAEYSGDDYNYEETIDPAHIRDGRVELREHNKNIATG